MDAARVTGQARDNGPEAPDRMTRGGIIASFVFGGIVIVVLGTIANRAQHAPPPPPPPRITIISDTVGSNPFSIRFTADQAIRDVPAGVNWNGKLLHPHLVVDSTMLMPSVSATGSDKRGSETLAADRDTLTIVAPRLTAGVHTIRLFWADQMHVNLGDTAIQRIRILQ